MVVASISTIPVLPTCIVQRLLAVLCVYQTELLNTGAEVHATNDALVNLNAQEKNAALPVVVEHVAVVHLARSAIEEIVHPVVQEPVQLGVVIAVRSVAYHVEHVVAEGHAQMVVTAHVSRNALEENVARIVAVAVADRVLEAKYVTRVYVYHLAQILVHL